MKRVLGKDSPNLGIMRMRWPVLPAMVVVNMTALLTALGILLEMKPEDRISVRRGCVLTLLGFVYFMSLYEACVRAALHTPRGARFRARFRLTVGDCMDICNKVVSGVQAVFSCAAGAAVCAWSCARDLLRASHVVSEGYAWFGAAYFFYDIYSMYTVHVTMRAEALQKKGASKGGGGEGGGNSFLRYCRDEPVILMHHLFIGGFGFLVIVYLRGGLGDCVFGFVYLMELSTPFVSARGILSRLDLKATRVYLYNGLAMLFTFFVCRVLSLPYVCLLYSRELGLSYMDAIATLPTGCKVSILVLLLPQLYWFWLMAVGAVRVLTGRAPRRLPRVAGEADKRS